MARPRWTLPSRSSKTSENHPDIATRMIYVYAALKSCVPYANGAPNLSVDFPAMMDLA